MIRKLLLFSLIAVLLVPVVSAQDEITTGTVVEMVMTVPEIADGLAALTAYDTLVYNSNNAYGIWQVEFRNADGEQVAWAQVQPETGRVYAWDAYFAAEDAAYEAVVPVYQEFVASHPDVRELVRGIDADDIYPWWDSNEQAWIAWIGDAGDAIMVAVQFDGGESDSTENPVLTELWFPNLPSYDEWRVAAASQAVAVAFQEVEIAIALRGKTWTTESDLVETGDTNIWTVTFLADGEAVATAMVDILDGAVLAYEIA